MRNIISVNMAAANRLRFTLIRVTSFRPGNQTAKKRFDIGKTQFMQDLRRTGAGFFAWSGAIRNDLRIFSQFLITSWNFLGRHRYSAGNMSSLILLQTANIQKNRLASIKFSFRFS